MEVIKDVFVYGSAFVAGGVIGFTVMNAIVTAIFDSILFVLKLWG